MQKEDGMTRDSEHSVALAGLSRNTAYHYGYGNAHFASIDACHFDASATTDDWNLCYLSDTVIDWLDEDLPAAQAARVRHIFVFGHPEAWAPPGRSCPPRTA
jgi:hypothetical protein